MAQRFAIASRTEAVAYLAHGVLGFRLKECTALITAVEGRTVREILGSPDDLKFQSSMTLFSAVSSDPKIRRGHRDALRRKARPKDVGSIVAADLRDLDGSLSCCSLPSAKCPLCAQKQPFALRAL